LAADPEDLPNGVTIDPCYLNPIFVLSKVPRKFRSMYTEATVCAAMEVDGEDEGSVLARRQMGMQSRGKPLDRVTAASVLAATKALGSDAPIIKHDLLTMAKQLSAKNPKPKSRTPQRKRTHAMMSEGGGLDPDVLRWSFLCERQIRQLEWMEVPGTMHVACPVCKASYLSAAPFMKRRHLEGCTMGQCMLAMPNSLQIELRRMQNFPNMMGGGSNFATSNYYKASAATSHQNAGAIHGHQQSHQGASAYYHGSDTKIQHRQPQQSHRNQQQPQQSQQHMTRPQMASPTSSANSSVTNLPNVDASFAGNFGAGLTGTAGMLQRNASFRLQNLQTLASMSNGSKGPGSGNKTKGGSHIPSLGSFAPSSLANAASTMAGQSMTQEQIISWMEDAMVKPGTSSGTSTAATVVASSATPSSSSSSSLPRLQSIGDLMRHQSMSDILGKGSSMANLAKAINGGSQTAAGSGPGQRGHSSGPNGGGNNKIAGGSRDSGGSNGINKNNLLIPGVTMVKDEDVKV